jgi:magnesium-transporting ATPase (P-type)
VNNWPLTAVLYLVLGDLAEGLTLCVFVLAVLVLTLAAAAKPSIGGDDQPTVFAGTFVVRGHGTLRVTATGMRGQMGRIGATLNQIGDEVTPLQEQIAQLVKVLAFITLFLCGVMVFILGRRADGVGERGPRSGDEFVPHVA